MNEEISAPILLLVAVILTTQSLYLFMDARRNGHNYWLWGAVGLIQAPMPTLVYLIFVKKIWRRKHIS